MPSSYYVEVDPNESGISIDLDETILEEDDTNDNVNSTNGDTCKRNCSGGGTQTVHREIQGDRNAGGKTDRSIKNPYVSSKTNDATAIAAAEDDSERRMDNDETMLLSDAENFEMEQAKSVVPREHLKDREQGIFDGSNNMDEDVSKMEIDGIENDVNPKIDGVANFTPTDTMPCGSTQPMVLRGGGPSSASYSNDNLQQNSKSFQNRLLSQSIQNAMKKVDDEDGDDYVDNLTESQLLKLLAKRQKERQRALAESLYKDSDSEKDEDSDCDGDTGDRFNFSCDVGGTGSSFASRTQSFQQYKNQKQQRHQQSVECQSTQQSIEHSFMTQETSVVNNRTVNNNLSFDFPMSEASGNKCSGPHQSNNVENIRQAKYQQDNNQYSKHLNSRNSTQPTNSFQNTNPTLEKSGIINPYQKNRQSTSQSSSLSSYNSIFSDTRNDGIERNNRTAGSVENNIRNATGEHGMNFRPTIDSTNSIKSGSGTCHHAASKLNSGGDRNPSLVSELVLDPRIQNESSQNANLGNVGDSACNDAPVQAQQRRRKSFFDKDQQPIACSSGGWEEDAFRSSLIDLLAAFPASMVFGEANTDDVDICSEMEEKSDRFCSSAYEEEGETPCSTTSSQAFESAQLQRKRYFDAASRALVRLAIASRGTATSNINDDGHRGGSDISRSTGSRAMNDECAPPSPRSLPSFISVLNVPGNCNNPIDNDQWRDNQRQRSFSTSSSSQEIFVGRSVHGRNARTVCLWSGMPKRSKKSNCTNDKNDNRDLFESWTNDRLAFLAMKVAAKVCHQSWQRWHLQYSCGSTNGLCISIEEGNTNSSRVTGFVEESQCRNGKSKTTKLLSPAIVESSLEFLATSFACLEADLVYSVLGTRLSMNSAGHSNDLCFDTCPKIFTVFDVILCFSVNINATVISPMVSTLAFLSLSRGLAAAQYVARYAASLDPSSCCSAYCSVNFSISEGTDVDDFRINDGGIGWLSALGKDLSLSLDSEFEFSPRSSKCLSGSRYSYLCLIASTVYDCIMEYDSSISSGTKEFASLCEEKQNADRKVKPQGSLFIETTGGCGHSEFRQSSIMKDRVLADKVEYLSSLIQIGVVVGWLSVEQTPNNDDSDEQNRRTVNNLCQKLFLILETRSRQRYSTNQNISKSDPGDSEAVCAACLSLLALLLERHRDSTTASSLSSSFRQMGGSSGTIQDLFESPMVQRIADMALSWSGSNSNDKMTKSHGTESERSQNIHAISYSINILSDIVKAGGGPLVRSKFPKRMDIFLTNVVESICKRGRSQSTELSSSKDIESVLLIILHLHACCSAVIRQFLRSYLEQSSAEKGVGNNLLFTSGILFLCADKSFAVSSCASFLLRALLDGSPSNRTQDHLSELLQESLNHDSYVSLALEHALIALIGVFNANEKDSEKSLLPRHLQQPDFETTNTMFPSISVARTCSLCDLLGECLQSARPICVLATAFSSQHFDDNILDIFLRASKFGSQQHAFDISTINGSAHLSLLFLLTTFSTNASAYEISEHEEESFRRQQSIINQHITNLVGRQCSNVDASVVSFSSLQAAMIQGSSVDMTHRSIKLQRNMDSLFGDARPLAFNLTFASGSLYDHRKFLQDKIKQNKCEFKSLVSKYERVEIERDNLVRALNEQRLASHRQLEWIKTEAQLTSRNSAQIHFIERKRAEERAKNSELKHRTESEARISAEHANQQLMEECERLKRELSSDKSKIQELEKMLEEERKSSQQAIISLDKCKMDLAIASDELERTTFMSNELQSKLIFSEEKTKELNASNQLLEANLEDICSKLIKLSFIYQSKEESTTKVKNELRSALIAANKHADTAIAKYETAKQENKSLRKKLDQTSQELQQAKAHRAEVQRQRKHAPISYINQLHKDPSLKDKRQQKRSEGAERVRRPGKENSFVDR